jgi:endogenous inhibitor of DNA gyrase (YacG/DUF329 family)
MIQKSPEMKTPACSICGKPVDPVFKPFCSKRCADVDLHRWLSGAYTIAGDRPEEAPAPRPGEEND